MLGVRFRPLAFQYAYHRFWYSSCSSSSRQQSLHRPPAAGLGFASLMHPLKLQLPIIARVGLEPTCIHSYIVPTWAPSVEYASLFGRNLTPSQDTDIPGPRLVSHIHLSSNTRAGDRTLHNDHFQLCAPRPLQRGGSFTPTR